MHFEKSYVKICGANENKHIGDITVPNIKSAKKRVLVTEKKTLQNKMITSEIKTEIKKFNDAVAANDVAKAEELLKSCVSLIDSATLKGVYNKNYASRKRSQLAKALNTIK